MENLVDITAPKMLLALGMIAASVALSVWQKLGLTRSLLWAALRSVMQLVFVGFLLDAVFALKESGVVVGIVGLMSVVAAKEATNRMQKSFPYDFWLVWGAVLVGTLTTLVYVTLLVLQPSKWYSPQYVIPLAGMILGQSMNGAAIAGERLTQALTHQVADIETHLCLGATPAQAIAGFRRAAIKAAMIPTINVMMVAGVVTLPGIMTGQILSGVSPLLAVRYQLLILFAITAADLLTTWLVTDWIGRQFFNQAQQLQTQTMT